MRAQELPAGLDVVLQQLKGHDMEPESRKEQRRRDVEDAKRELPSPEKQDVKPPFASDGLEQVRDSHC